MIYEIEGYKTLTAVFPGAFLLLNISERLAGSFVGISLLFDGMLSNSFRNKASRGGTFTLDWGGGRDGTGSSSFLEKFLINSIEHFPDTLIIIPLYNLQHHFFGYMMGLEYPS